MSGFLVFGGVFLRAVDFLEYESVGVGILQEIKTGDAGFLNRVLHIGEGGCFESRNTRWLNMNKNVNNKHGLIFLMR